MRIRAALPLALALLLAAAGCRREADTVLRRVRVFSQLHLSAGPLYLAEAEGYFREEGLAIDWVTAGSSRDLLPSLVEGELDVLASNLSPVFLNAVAQGARLRVVRDRDQLVVLRAIGATGDDLDFDEERRIDLPPGVPVHSE